MSLSFNHKQNYHLQSLIFTLYVGPIRSAERSGFYKISGVVLEFVLCPSYLIEFKSYEV